MLITDLQQPDKENLETARNRLRMSKTELSRYLGVRTETYNSFLLSEKMSPLVLNRLDMLLKERRVGHLSRR